MDKLELAKEIVRIYFEKQCSVEKAIAEVLIMQIDSTEEFSEVYEDVEYDRSGYMKANPFYHPVKGRWNKDDLDYFINWINIIGFKEMSLALGRPIINLKMKAKILRKKGLLKKKKPIAYRPSKATSIEKHSLI